MDRVEDDVQFEKVAIPGAYDSNEHKAGGVGVGSVEEVDDLQNLAWTGTQGRALSPMKLE